MTTERVTPKRLRGWAKFCETDTDENRMLIAASTIEALERELAEAKARLTEYERTIGRGDWEGR